MRPVSNDLNIPPSSEPTAGEGVLRQLLQTRDAFDSVAADYDGPRGNNASIQDMRAEMWRTVPERERVTSDWVVAPRGPS